MKKKYKNTVKLILLNLIFIYIFLGLLFFIFQKSFIYQPSNQDFENCKGFEDYKKMNYNKTRFYFKEKTQSAIIYYHGNAGSTCDRSAIKQTFEETNYSLIFVEYTGYSNDNKNPSKKTILKDVENIENFLNERNYTNNIIYAQSVGAGAASYHASFGNIQKLIFISPFSSMTDLVRSKIIIYPVKLLLTENYNNIEWLKEYNGTIKIIHGDSDKVINPKLSRKLFDNLITKEKEYILINGYGHNNIWYSKRFNELIKSYLDQYINT